MRFHAQKFLKAFYATIFLLLCGWMSFLHPLWVLLIGIFTSVIGYFVLSIAFTPIGHLKLGESDQISSWFIWFMQILKGQVVMLILTAAAGYAFLGHGPSYANQTISVEDFASMMEYYHAWWGIFPWGIFALWGLITAYLIYVKKWLPFLYQTAKDYCPKRFQPFIKGSIEGATSSASVLCIALSACSVILLFAYGFQKFIEANHFDVPVVSALVFSFLMMLPLIRPLRKKIQAQTRIYGLSRLMVILIILFILALIAATFANARFMAAFPDDYLKGQCSQCLNYFKQVPHQTRLAVLYWGWWIIWTPIAGSYLAKISKGRTIREFILGVFFIPCLLIILYLIMGSAPFLWGLEKIILNQSSLKYFIWGGVSWFFLSQIVKKQFNTNFFVIGLVESPEGPEDRMRLSTGSKKIGLSHYSSKFLTTLVGTLFLQTIAGWYGIQIQVGAVAIHMIFTIYLGGLFIIGRFVKDKIWRKEIYDRVN